VEKMSLMRYGRNVTVISLSVTLFASGCTGARDKTPETRSAGSNVAVTPSVVPTTAAKSPLGNNAFKAGLSVSNPPATIRAGQQQTLIVSVKNESSATWPSRGQANLNYQVNIGNHWLDGTTLKIVVNDDGRKGLPYDLKPGDEIQLSLTVTAPPKPGKYILEIDVVQEGVSWFGLKGSKPFRVSLPVSQ
jgi:hypothetical protein